MPQVHKCTYRGKLEAWNPPISQTMALRGSPTCPDAKGGGHKRPEARTEARSKFPPKKL